jgi:ankyrin repeat protein
VLQLGNSPLHSAARGGHVSTTSLLLERNADPRHVNKVSVVIDELLFVILGEHRAPNCGPGNICL